MYIIIIINLSSPLRGTRLSSGDDCDRGIRVDLLAFSSFTASFSRSGKLSDSGCRLLSHFIEYRRLEECRLIA